MKVPVASVGRSVVSDFCDPMDCSLPGSSAHGILQARILEWVGIPSPGDLPDTGMEPGSPAMQADSLPLSYQEKAELGPLRVGGERQGQEGRQTRPAKETEEMPLQKWTENQIWGTREG